MKHAHKILVDKTEGKRLFGRLTHRRVDKIKMDLRKTGSEIVV